MNKGVRTMESIYGSVVVAAVVALGVVGCDSPSADASADDRATGRRGAAAEGKPTNDVVAVTVDGEGFSPSRIVVKQGSPATLRLTRTTDQTCAKRVAFPELKLEKDLPLGKSVDISVPSEEARTLAFQCGMGMYKGAVVIN